MKNMKIGKRITLGFACILLLLMVIASTSVMSFVTTGNNIGEIDIYSGLQNNSNALLHILNETRVTASLIYEVPTDKAYGDINKQLMYCDTRLKKLNDYVSAYPQLAELGDSIDGFETLYSEWRQALSKLSELYVDSGGLATAAYSELAKDAHRVNLLAHETISNTGLEIDDMVASKLSDTQGFNAVALIIVIAMSALSVIAAVIFGVIIMRSITRPMDNMRDALVQIGRTGDLHIPDALQGSLEAAASARDETAQCAHALLALVDRLNNFNETLSCVADGDLTVDVSLKSEHDSMGKAVERMLRNLNQKFGTIALSTQQVNSKTSQLSAGSQQLAHGSQEQNDSVRQLSDTVTRVNQKTQENTSLANQAAALAQSIQENAHTGTQRMEQMMQAAEEINSASHAIENVIRVIDSIAFQTNILALNAAVEAARAGQHGKGFAVVAEEVRSLAAKSSEAARNTGALIANTIEKAELGSSIAKTTAKALEDIASGVGRSNLIIGNIAELSKEQADAIGMIISGVEHVERVVLQNTEIASQSASAAGEISAQTTILKDLVEQFSLIDTAAVPHIGRHATGPDFQPKKLGPPIKTN